MDFCLSSSDLYVQAELRNSTQSVILVLAKALNLSAHHLLDLSGQAVSKEISLPNIHKGFKNTINLENFGIFKN